MHGSYTEAGQNDTLSVNQEQSFVHGSILEKFAGLTFWHTSDTSILKVVAVMVGVEGAIEERVLHSGAHEVVQMDKSDASTKEGLTVSSCT